MGGVSVSCVINTLSLHDLDTSQSTIIWMLGEPWSLLKFLVLGGTLIARVLLAWAFEVFKNP